MTRAVQHDGGQVIDILAHGFGYNSKVLRHGRFEVDLAFGLRPDGDFVHINEWTWVEHGTAWRNRNGGNRVGATEGQRTRAIDRVDSHIHFGRFAVANVFAVVKHGCVILLTLADHDHAVHINGT